MTQHSFKDVLLEARGAEKKEIFLLEQIDLPSSQYIFGTSWVALMVKNPPANAGDRKRCGFDPWKMVA